MSEYPIGTVESVQFLLETEPFHEIPAELCIVGIFAEQPSNRKFGGAMANLDAKFAGGIAALRSDGIFTGGRGETMLLSSPPIAADALLLVGLGDIQAWDAASGSTVAGAAMCEAIRLRVSSAVFAPCLQDGGLDPASTEGTAAAMMASATAALRNRAAPAPALVLRRWVFTRGIEWRDVTLESLRSGIG